MKCPLLQHTIFPPGEDPEQMFEECLKEECAWWDDGHPGCSILTIAQELATKRQKEEVKS